MTAPQTPDTGWVARAFSVLGTLPTTQGAFVVGAIAILATTIRYVFSHEHVVGATISPAWEPSVDWLVFLLALAGINTAHFLGKRVTDTSYVAAKRANGGTTPPAAHP